MSKELEEALNGLASYIMYTDDNSDESASAIEWHNTIKKYINQQEKKEERAKKEHELLELYRLEKEAKEKYHTSGSLYVMQRVLDELREIAEEINLKEKELEEMK